MSAPNVSPSLNSPPARVVNDFHRNSDLDVSFEAQHHSLGMDRYQSARGDHIHDGSTGVALLEDVVITGNLGTTALGAVVKSLLQALSNHLGLVDNTTQV